MRSYLVVLIGSYGHFYLVCAVSEKLKEDTNARARSAGKPGRSPADFSWMVLQGERIYAADKIYKET